GAVGLRRGQMDGVEADSGQDGLALVGPGQTSHQVEHRTVPGLRRLQADVGEGGSREVGAVERGTGEDDAGEFGLPKDGLSERGVAEVGSLTGGIAGGQRTLEVRTSQIDAHELTVLT